MCSWLDCTWSWLSPKLTVVRDTLASFSCFAAKKVNKTPKCQMAHTLTRRSRVFSRRKCSLEYYNVRWNITMFVWTLQCSCKHYKTNFESLDGSARDLHDECLPVVPPVGVSFSEGRPLLQHHDVNVISSHRANNPPKSTEFLYAIEVRMPCFSCIFFIQHWSF